MIKLTMKIFQKCHNTCMSKTIVKYVMCLIQRLFKRWPLRSSGIASTESPTPQAVPIKKFVLHYKKMTENSGKIKSEFQLLQMLSTDVMLPTKDAIIPANKRKNRYINVLPFDDNRVKLKVQNMSDYVNASYIKGYTSGIEYLAAQGPTELTCAAFWQMIYDEDVKIVIMLTQFIEQGKEKCYKYFPNVMEESEIETIEMKIQCLEEEIQEIYTQRKLVAIKDNKSKEVIHLLFNKWPDFGVPTRISHMLNFRDTMNDLRRSRPGLILVHCSAGVGRTGTLIALDILMQAIRNKQKVDIFGTVFNLRKQRMTMVQSEKQYEFLYKCVQEIILRQGRHYVANDIDRIEESDDL